MPAPDAIERVLRGDASREELESIAAWRRDSPENEREYRRLERLVRAAGSLRTETRAAVPPSAAELIARMRGPGMGGPERTDVAGPHGRSNPWRVAMLTTA